MYTLTLLLMIKSTAGHTMEINVDGFSSVEECSAAKVSIVEKTVGWGKEPTLWEGAPERVLASYCKKSEESKSLK